MNSTETEAKKWVEASNNGIHETIEYRESSMGSIVFKFLPSRRMKDLLGYG